MAKDFIVIFVEGETEKEFYDTLISYYRSRSIKTLKPHKVINMKGIGKFESKLGLKLKGDILSKHDPKIVQVICCHDTDVFELAQKPPVDWKAITKKIEAMGVKSFQQIKAQRMIEDWFLNDFEGICHFLKLKNVKSVNGKDANEKLKILFKKGGKLYIKGSHTQKFIPSLNISKIRAALKKPLSILEKALGVIIND